MSFLKLHGFARWPSIITIRRPSCVNNSARPYTILRDPLKRLPHRLLQVPARIERPEYAYSGEPHLLDFIEVKDDQDALKCMREAGQLAKRVLDFGGSLCQPGVTTAQINDQLHSMIIKNGAYPSPLNYKGFPASICTSVNNVVVHGIPDDRPLEDGDIINIDITVFLNGFHGDTSQTFFVGRLNEQKSKVDGQRLIRATNDAMWAGIRAVKPGQPVNVIGRAIETVAAHYGFLVSPEYYGHGIGRHFHEPPVIPHFYDSGETLVMEPGMTFTIEPVLIDGDSTETETWSDGWTVVTKNGARAAQAEHTVLVTETGVEVLTG